MAKFVKQKLELSVKQSHLPSFEKGFDILRGSDDISFRYIRTKRHMQRSRAFKSLNPCKTAGVNFNDLFL